LAQPAAMWTRRPNRTAFLSVIMTNRLCSLKNASAAKSCGSRCRSVMVISLAAISPADKARMAMSPTGWPTPLASGFRHHVSGRNCFHIDIDVPRDQVQA
jgi:hypothetical protein